MDGGGRTSCFITPFSLYKTNKALLQWRFLCSFVYFLNANQNFFISSFLSCTAFFVLLQHFFFHPQKICLRLKELPLYAGALQRESSFAHLSVSFIQFSLKARGNPSRSFRLTRGRSRQTGRRTPGRTSAGARDRRASSRIYRSNRPARPRAASRRIPSRICRC